MISFQHLYLARLPRTSVRLQGSSSKGLGSHFDGNLIVWLEGARETRHRTGVIRLPGGEDGGEDDETWRKSMSVIEAGGAAVRRVCVASSLRT